MHFELSWIILESLLIPQIDFDLRPSRKIGPERAFDHPMIFEFNRFSASIIFEFVGYLFQLAF